MGDYTSPEDEAFFSAIGRLTVAWSMIEAGLDMSVTILHQALDGKNHESERPIALKRKLKYLRRITPKLPRTAHLAEKVAALCDEVKGEAETRHDIIHGFVVEHIEKSGEAKLIRFIHETDRLRQKDIKINTEAMMHAAGRTNKIASRSIDLAATLTAVIVEEIQQRASKLGIEAV